jgi:hypothetical protein
MVQMESGRADDDDPRKDLGAKPGMDGAQQPKDLTFGFEPGRHCSRSPAKSRNSMERGAFPYRVS